MSDNTSMSERKSSGILVGSHYKPGRGGHAPGDLRDAFCAAVDAYQDWDEGEPEPTVEVRDRQLPISQIFGLLWDCKDILPSIVYDQVCAFFRREDEPRRQTYAAAARAMKYAVAKVAKQEAGQ
jgi:hypothetical protein